ncbi:MAG: sugar phosphate isomerase/epimerase family protein [Phycisphaeraceae bacterium]
MSSDLTRRGVLLGGAAASVVVLGSASVSQADDEKEVSMPLPPMNHRYLLSCKLGMITKKGADGKPLTLADRLSLAKQAGFDGVDLDQAAEYTPQEARASVAASGVFVHNAINHAHWKKRFTSSSEADRKQALDNLLHCIRVSHAAGGSAVLLVPGSGNDGPEAVCAERAIAEIKKAIPLAAALGQRILFENVWNQMFYDHDKGPEQSADRWAAFVDAFDSPWVGMYHDIGNHWKYGNPADWIRTFGPRAVKFDVKGYSRAKNAWTDIGEGDLPWDQVRTALGEVGFTGWFTAEVGGGGLDRLKTVRNQMAQVLGVG